MNSESEQRRAPESPHEDIRQRLSMEQEDKLDGLQAKHDEVIDRLRGLGNQLDTLGAAKDDMRMEVEQLDDLQRRDPEAAARSRELLADEIRNDDIGQDRATVTEAIRSAEAQQAHLEDAMEAIYAGGPDDDAGGDADGRPGDVSDEDDSHEEHDTGQGADDIHSPDRDYSGHDDGPDRDYSSHDDGGYDSHDGSYGSYDGGDEEPY